MDGTRGHPQATDSFFTKTPQMKESLLKTNFVKRMLECVLWLLLSG